MAYQVNTAASGLSVAVRDAIAVVVGQLYLLRATFNADDQGYADDQVLDTPEEGVSKGQLTIVEVDGTLAIVSNKCAFTAQETPAWEDLGFYSQAITRVLGRGLLHEYKRAIEDSIVIRTGFTHAAALGSSPKHGFSIRYIGVMNAIYDAGTRIVNVWPFIIFNTTYHFAIVLGGYHSNGEPWRWGQAAASYLHGAAILAKGANLGSGTEWVLVWRSQADNTDPIYAEATILNDVGTLDNFRVPDADLSAVLQPTCLSLFASAGELSDYTPELGGAWAEDIGDWDVADGVLKATVLGIATFTGLADCLYDAKITTPAAGTTAGGLVLRVADLTGASEDYWYLKITPGTAGVDWELIEYVAGNPTQRASGDVDWAAATAYNIRAIPDDEEIGCFANGGNKISYASAVSSKTETSFGTRDEGNANLTFDIVALFARTSSVYDDTLDAV